MTAAARLKKARRIMRVQEQLHRAERNNLARLERELDQVEAAERRIAEAFGKGDFSDTLTDLAIVRLRSLSREGRRLMREREKQRAATTTQEARLKRTEKAAHDAGREASREHEEHALHDLLDRRALIGVVRPA